MQAAAELAANAGRMHAMGGRAWGCRTSWLLTALRPCRAASGAASAWQTPSRAVLERTEELLLRWSEFSAIADAVFRTHIGSYVQTWQVRSCGPHAAGELYLEPGA